MPSVDPAPAYAATLQHCHLIQGRIAHLHAVLEESRVQFARSVNREYSAGRITLKQLIEAYEAMRGLGGGFSTVWNANVTVGSKAINNLRQPGMFPTDPSGLSWSGPWPFVNDHPRPMKGTSVVYLLLDAANEPIYLGSSARLSARVSRHARDGKPVAWWVAYPQDSREAAYLLEDGLLKTRKPRMNVKAGR